VVEDSLALRLRHIAKLPHAGIKTGQVTVFLVQYRAKRRDSISIESDCRKLGIVEMLRKPFRVSRKARTARPRQIARAPQIGKCAELQCLLLCVGCRTRVDRGKASPRAAHQRVEFRPGAFAALELGPELGLALVREPALQSGRFDSYGIRLVDSVSPGTYRSWWASSWKMSLATSVSGQRTKDERIGSSKYPRVEKAGTRPM
jgi:hypothetical protein